MLNRQRVFCYRAPFFVVELYGVLLLGKSISVCFPAFFWFRFAILRKTPRFSKAEQNNCRTLPKEKQNKKAHNVEIECFIYFVIRQSMPKGAG